MPTSAPRLLLKLRWRARFWIRKRGPSKNAKDRHGRRGSKMPHRSGADQFGSRFARQKHGSYLFLGITLCSLSYEHVIRAAFRRSPDHGPGVKKGPVAIRWQSALAGLDPGH